MLFPSGFLRLFVVNGLLAASLAAFMLGAMGYRDYSLERRVGGTDVRGVGLAVAGFMATLVVAAEAGRRAVLRRDHRTTAGAWSRPGLLDGDLKRVVGMVAGRKVRVFRRSGDSCFYDARRDVVELGTGTGPSAAHVFFAAMHEGGHAAQPRWRHLALNLGVPVVALVGAWLALVGFAVGVAAAWFVLCFIWWQGDAALEIDADRRAAKATPVVLREIDITVFETAAFLEWVSGHVRRRLLAHVLESAFQMAWIGALLALLFATK